MARSPAWTLLLVAAIACVLILPAAAGCYGSGQYGSQEFGRGLVGGFCGQSFPQGETSQCWQQDNQVKWYLRARNGCGNIVTDSGQCSAAMMRMIACDGGGGQTRGGNDDVGCMEYVADPNAGNC